MGKKGDRALKKITKLLEQYVGQHGQLMQFIEKGAQRSLTAAGERADAGRAGDLHQRIEQMENRAAQRQQADDRFRAELLAELRRHNELVAAALAHALPNRPPPAKPETPTPEAAKPEAPKLLPEKPRPAAKPSAKPARK